MKDNNYVHVKCEMCIHNYDWYCEKFKKHFNEKSKPCKYFKRDSRNFSKDGHYRLNRHGRTLC